MKKIVYILLLFSMLFSMQKTVYATHSMGLDLTYKCLGEDTFLVTLTFYRDCAGVNAPNSTKINIFSNTCGLSFTQTLPNISFRELDAVCASLQTTCSGGTYPGIEEYIYQGIVILPAKCTDWTMGYALCCRNNAITNVANPGSEKIYAETSLNNTAFTCNNSPIFTSTPVPFMCQNKLFCFNNGAIDADGDSLAYSLVTPTTGPNLGDTINYITPFSPTNPVTSNPVLSFNPINGDICILPTQLEVSVMQILIKEYRNGVLIGTIERDIQIRVVNCPNNNNLPYVDGINGTGVFDATICAGDTFTFNTNSIDVDATNTVTMAWSGAFQSAAFNISGGTRPVGTFKWFPDTSNISTNPYCFTVKVTDDNCPFLGTQSFSFCLTVQGIKSKITAIQNIDCFGNCTGSATVAATGGSPPYTYIWDDSINQATATASNLCVGAYRVTTTDTNGCSWISDTTLTAPILLDVGITSFTNINCKSGSDGTANALAIGGTAPYIFNWSNGSSGQNINNLTAGAIIVTITDNNGCTADTTLNLTEPTLSLTATSISTLVFCKGGNNGTATITPSGGIGVYTFLWDAAANNQTTPTATGLVAGNYNYSVTDANGCIFNTSILVSEPTTALILATSTVNTSCFQTSDGNATINPSGGISPYTFLWDVNAINQTTAIANNLSIGTYTVTVTDNNLCENTANVIINQPAVLGASFTPTQATCSFNNGAILISSTGGSPAYNYVWAIGQTTNNPINLSSGVYNVTVSDNNGCSLDTFAILNNIFPTVSVTTTNPVLCAGILSGTATATGTGGLLPYTFLWGDGQTNAVAVGLPGGMNLVTLTDANNCHAITLTDIPEPASFIVTISTNNVSCFATSTGDASAIATGGVSPYTYQWSTSANSQTSSTASGLFAGSYSVTVTDNNACFQVVGITITEPIAITLTTTNTNVNCFGGTDGKSTVSPLGGTTPYSYLWNAAANNQTTATAINLSVGNVAVIVTDASNCSQLISTTLTEPVLLDSDTSFTNVLCKGGSSGAAMVVAQGGTTPYAYLWNNNSLSASITGLISGSYLVTITDNNLCVKTTSVTISEPLLSLSESVTTTGINCLNGSDGTATVLGVGGTSPYAYLWAIGAQTTSQITGINAGNFIVTITDFNNCTIPGNTTVTLVEPSTSVTVNLITQGVSCFGGNDGTATSTPSGGTSPYTYLWSNGKTSSFNIALTVGNYSLTVTDKNGCVANMVTSITEPSVVTSTTITTAVSCNGESNGTANITAAGGTTPYFYNWSNGTTTTNLTGLTAGIYTVSIKDINTCILIDSLIVQEPSVLTLAGSFTSTLCNGDQNGTATAIASGGTTPYTYQWDVSSAFQNSSTATGLAAGFYVTTATDANNCNQFIGISVTEPSLISVITTPALDTICVGENIAIGANTSGGSAGYTYNWNENLGTGQSKNVSPTQTTTYNVTVTDQSGCIGNVGSILIFVRNLFFEPIVLSKSGDLCFGDTTTITGDFLGTFPPYTFMWSNNLGDSLGTYTIAPTDTSTYFLTVTDICNNSILDSIEIIVNPLPIINTQLTPSSGCDPLPVTFTNNSDLTNLYNYQWDFGDGFSSISDTANNIFTPDGIYFVNVTATSNKGCISTTNNTDSILVFPKPKATCTISPEATDLKHPVIEFQMTSSDVISFQWNFSNGDSSSFINVTKIYQDTGTYPVTLMVENEFHCRDTILKEVRITPSFIVDVPNAFTPNPDGSNGGVVNINDLSNDVFFPITKFVLKFHMMIFNRWGELLFESFDKKIGWDGYFNGVLSPQDVYIWKIEAQFTDFSWTQKVGDITLIR